MEAKVVPVAPSSRYYVELSGGKYREKTESGLFIATDFNRGEHAEVTGIIKSLPRRGGIPGLRVGDEIAFSYLVVYDEEVIGADNDEVFYEDAQLHPNFVTWSNALGVSITRQYCMNDKYKGFKKNKEGIIVDQVEGNFSKVESWLETNKFRERAGHVNNNLLEMDGVEYWSVPVDMVYAVKRDDKMETVPGYLLCDLPAAKVVERKEGALIAIDYQKEDTAWLPVKVGSYVEGYEPAGVEVCVRMDAVPIYKFWGKEYVLVREDQILMQRGAETLDSKINYFDPSPEAFDGPRLSNHVMDEAGQWVGFDYESRKRETSFSQEK